MRNDFSIWGLSEGDAAKLRGYSSEGILKITSMGVRSKAYEPYHFIVETKLTREQFADLVLSLDYPATVGWKAL